MDLAFVELPFVSGALVKLLPARAVVMRLPLIHGTTPSVVDAPERHRHACEACSMERKTEKEIVVAPASLGNFAAEGRLQHAFEATETPVPSDAAATHTECLLL